MKIIWNLRFVSGTVAREKDTASVNTTVYGSTARDSMLSASTSHSKQLWVETEGGKMISAKLNHTENVSASKGDRVRIVFADPGAHVVGIRNETLQITWKWKYPNNIGFLGMLTPLAILGSFIGGLVALWEGKLAVAAFLLGMVAYIVVVPLGRNRRRIRELHGERDAFLSAGTTTISPHPHLGSE